MNVIVKKYGGTSVGSIERIEVLAEKLVKQRTKDEQVVIVVSAMAKTTDYLYSLAYQISDTPYQRELDMLATAGERISMSLLSIALHKQGASAISFTGSQSGIITSNCHGNAEIIDVSAFRIRSELAKGKFVIVAGYQGVSLEKEITTLGRGGSDTTAVALAGYLGAKSCEIYTDVDGVYTADPHLVKEATRLNAIDYDTMLYLARSGCKVIHPRAVEFALKYDLELEIKSSFNDNRGTKVGRNISMEEKEIRAITGRERLIAFDIDLNSQENSLEKILQGNNPEICDYTILKPKLLRLLLEESRGDLLRQKLADSSIETIAEQRDLCSITVAGLKVSSDSDLLSKVLILLERERKEVFWLTRNHLGFTAYFSGGGAKEVQQLIHRELIKD